MEGSAAQAGFYYQNNVAALKILDMLIFDSDIGHIVLENYEKGKHIDDVIIYRKSSIEYFQVKWSEDGENSYTLYNLLNAQASKKSIFRQLAEGYTSVKDGVFPFTIVLYTTKRVSSQKRPADGIDHSLSEIISKIINPLKAVQDSYTTLESYADYSKTLEMIRNECGLDEGDFSNFLRSLDFRFSQETLEGLRAILKTKMEKLGIEHGLLGTLLDAIVNWSIKGDKITRGSVLDAIGITDRFEDKLSHFFRIVEDHYYVPNSVLLDKIDSAVKSLKGGYIFIEGLPGIGKSTALTRYRQENHEITLAYYCFIPDAQNNFMNLRHRTEYFHKSLCIAIEKQFDQLNLPGKYSDRYAEKLSGYIDKLGKLDKKVLFIIDGLDHVHRNTMAGDDSLLGQITGSLPENVFFILSSQYSSVLTPDVATLLKAQPERHIVVPRFSQSQIRDYLDAKNIVYGELLDQIEVKSGGIPLYLHYISELMADAEASEYQQILTDLPVLIDGKINHYHETLFSQIENDEFSKWLLALFAYRKENTSPEIAHEILQLAGEQRPLSEVMGVINRFKHLLRPSNARTYAIFHNSFREFILSKTDYLKDRFNNALISYYEAHPYTDEAYRNYFNHLEENGQYNKILQVTSVEWMKSAWRNFRTLDEISENLSVAMRAAIEKVSMTEFIRVAFIVGQFEQLKWNLDNSDIDFPTLQLEIGERANSLRSIWDGDFVLVDVPYFAYYLGKWHEKTGEQLPRDIISKGFSKSWSRLKLEQIKRIYQAQAFADLNLMEIFEEIDHYQWVTDNEDHGDPYERETHSREENRKTNEGIKRGVIDYLGEKGKYQVLIECSKSKNISDELRNYCIISLSRCLLKADRQSAISMIASCDLSVLDDGKHKKLLSVFIDQIEDDQLREIFVPRSLDVPTLHDKVIQNKGAQFAIHEEIIGFFGELKILHVYSKHEISALRLKIGALDSPAIDFYSAIFELYDIWSSLREKETSNASQLDRSKKALKYLFVRHQADLERRSRGLFDHDTTPSFIRYSIKNLYREFFGFFAEVLNTVEMEQLIAFWLELEDGQDGYHHYSNALIIAEILAKVPKHRKVTNLARLLEHAEKFARRDSETLSLTASLAEVCECCGLCGLKGDARRIYEELIDVAFGVGYRKDYQVTNIIEPMEMMHEIDPENSTGRLADILRIQEQLSGAGNNRMNHISISYFARFAGEISPGLAFKLLEFDEESLGRNESLEIVLKKLIDNCREDELALYLALIKTLPRWDSGGTSKNEFIILAERLLSRAIHYGAEAIINNVLEIVKYNTTVETNNIKDFEAFGDLLKNKGISPGKYNIPQAAEPPVEDKKIPLTQSEKFAINFKKRDFDEVVAMLNSDYPKLLEMLQADLAICVHNRRHGTFRDEYHRSKKHFERFYNEIPASIKEGEPVKLYWVRRLFLNFKNDVLKLDGQHKITYGDIETLFDQFVEGVNQLYPGNLLRTFISEKFRRKKWLEGIMGFLNDHMSYLRARVVDGEDVLRIAGQATVLNVHNVLDFIHTWADGRNRANALVKVANFLLPIDRDRASALLFQVSDSQEESLMFPNDEDKAADFDIMDTYLKTDTGKAKQFLLKTFYAQKGRNGGYMVQNLQHLVKYRSYFEDHQVVEVYYQSNLRYIKELAKGLEEVHDRYEFVRLFQPSESTEESLVQHLAKLLDYPVVKVRELTVQAIFDLLVERPALIGTFISYGFEPDSDNRAEWALVVLHGIALYNSSLTSPHKSALLKLTGSGHFNIVQGATDIIKVIASSVPAFLDAAEQKRVSAANSQSQLIIPLPQVLMAGDETELVSRFQEGLLQDINYEDISEDMDFSIYDRVYGDLYAKGYPDDAVELDLKVQRAYNINTNFDAIEIYSQYYDMGKSSINRVFYDMIRSGCFEQGFIDIIKHKFRVYDPSKLLFKVMARPNYINWVPDWVSEEDFNSFEDLDKLVKDFVYREEDFVTLAEYGMQRHSRGYEKLNATVQFEVFALTRPKGSKDIGDIRSGKLISAYNLYAHEISGSFGIGGEGLPVGWTEPIQISVNRFRGQNDLINAGISNDFKAGLGIVSWNLLDAMRQNSGIVNAFRWQDHYATSSDRWRYTPTSQGYTLRVSKKELTAYLNKKKLELCYVFKIRRSATPYQPDYYMEWKYRSKIFTDVLI